MHCPEYRVVQGTIFGRHRIIHPTVNLTFRGYRLNGAVGDTLGLIRGNRANRIHDLRLEIGEIRAGGLEEP